MDSFGNEVETVGKARKKRPEVVKIAGTEYVSLGYLKSSGTVEGLGTRGLTALLESEGIHPVNVGRRKLYNKTALDVKFNPQSNTHPEI